MASDYDDIIVDLAALLAVLYVGFRANGVAPELLSSLLPVAAFLVAVYLVINVLATVWQGYHRERGS